MATQWTGENVSQQVKGIYAMPLEKRTEVAAEIRKDVRSWVECRFIFTTRQQKCMNLMPAEFFDFIGSQVALAIEKAYPLTIFVSDDTIPPAESKKGGEVGGGWNQHDGFHADVKFTF